MSLPRFTAESFFLPGSFAIPSPRMLPHLPSLCCPLPTPPLNRNVLGEAFPGHPGYFKCLHLSSFFIQPSLFLCLSIYVSIYHLSNQVGKPGGPQSMGSQRVRHDWATEPNWFQLSMCLSICPTIIYLCLSVYISVYMYIIYLSICLYPFIYMSFYLSSIFICLCNYHLSISIYLLSLSLYLPVSI